MIVQHSKKRKRPTLQIANAESCVVGSLLTWPNDAPKVFGFIEEKHFGNDDLRRVYAIAKEVYDEGTTPNAAIVRQAVREFQPDVPDDVIEHSLNNATTHLDAAMEKMVADFQARNLIHIAEKLNNDARDGRDPAEAAEHAQNLIADFVRTVPHKESTLISAPDLLGKHFAAPKWAIDGLIPEGLTLLVGPPKLGKSWFVLQMGLTVTSGGYAFGFGNWDTKPGHVLYYALEDTQRRLQNRLKKIRTRWPDMETKGLYFETTTRQLNDGFEAHLRSFLTQHPETRLVIIDTLNKVRPAAPKNADGYKIDYRDASILKAIADEFSVAIVAVHHTRKMKSDDVFEEVSGTQGLTGAADATIILKRDRGRADAVLHITGRDVEECEFAMSWDANAANWLMLGDAATVRLSKEMNDVKQLFDRDEFKSWTLKELYAEFPDKTEANVRKMMMKAVRNDIVRSPERGTYTHINHGTNGTKEQTEQEEQVEQV